MGVRTDQATLAANQTFRGAVRAAVMYRALAILNDANASEQFKGLARSLTQGDTAGASLFIENFIWRTLLTPAIVAKIATPLQITDAELDNAVLEAWDDVAAIRDTPMPSINMGSI